MTTNSSDETKQTAMQDAQSTTSAAAIVPQGRPPGGALFAAAVQLAPHGTLFVADDGEPRPLWGNPRAHALLGVEQGEILQWSQVPRPLAETIRELMDAGGGFATAVVGDRPGASSAIDVSVYPDADLTALFIVHLEEPREAQRHVAEWRVSAARFQAVAHQAPVGILASGVGLRMGFANEQACELLARGTDDILGLGWLDAVDRQQLDAVTEALAAVLDGGTSTVQFRVAATDRWVRMVAGPVHDTDQGAGIVATLEDITLARDHRAALQHQANHDQLTGLSNRGALLAALQRARDQLGNKTHALLFFDLDHFKFVNDALGHAVGDRLLTEIANRLRQRIRSGDVLARFGGDEFVLLCHDLSGVDDAVAIARRYASTFENQLQLEGRPFQVSASVGLAIAEAGTPWTPTSLLRDADAAMYQAKAEGRNRIAVFDADRHGQAQQRLQVATDLRNDLATGQLRLTYQPIVYAPDGRVLGSEALLRGRRPEHADLPIPELIKLAEETGLLRELSAWVLDEACRQLASWRAENRHPGWVAVNVSATQLTEEGFAELVLSTARDRGVQPSDLLLELTEGVLIDPEGAGVETLRHLRGAGVGIALDDFGTGWSSIAYLRTMPVDVIKIAPSFVSRVDTDPVDAAIVAAITHMVHTAGRGVIAEGVETRAQLDQLINLGCDVVQGYVFARPDNVPADRFPPYGGPGS